MRKERERRTLETAGMLFTLLFGNLLHFVYDWTGQAGWAAYLSAVNESTWEHMKLLAVPWLVWTIVTIAVNRCAALRSESFWPVSPASPPSRPCSIPTPVSWEKAWAWSTS